MSSGRDVNLWSSTEHALEYLRRADSIPHRVEGEATLLEFVPRTAKRILDVGTGDGRLLGLVRAASPKAEFVAIDFSQAMLDAARKSFSGEKHVTIMAHDFASELPALGQFDCVVSSFAIHHLHHDRKRNLYSEIFDILLLGGHFAIWSTSRLLLCGFTINSSRSCRFCPRRKIPPTNFWTGRRSSHGCGRSASSTSIVIGSGVRLH